MRLQVKDIDTKRMKIRASAVYEYVLGEGILENAADYILGALVRLPEKAAVITDRTCGELYAGPDNRLISSLREAGVEVHVFSFLPGEKSKTLRTAGEILEFLSGPPVSLGRDDLIIALGGGVTGDLAGFAASIYMRGTELVQIPTTITAALDSSVGGKNGVNLSRGKNLVGTIRQPALVLSDMEVFDTLSCEHISDGLTEALKCGIIRDRDLFEFIEGNVPELLRRERDALEHVIWSSVNVKRSLIEEDESDRGMRKLLNFGHTMGHGIERSSSYRISHGNAVMKGMCIELSLLEELGYHGEDILSRIKYISDMIGIGTEYIYSPDELMDAVLSDKKRKGNKIDLAFPVVMGNAEIRSVLTEDIKRALGMLSKRW